MKIGIIGNGFVGKATCSLECQNIEVIIYDIQKELCNPIGTNLFDIIKCDIIFISVPTPMNKDGSCYLEILNSVINELNSITDLDTQLVVIRSTVPPGTSNKLNCYFMPEFLTEKNYINDFINNKNWIFGVKNNAQDSTFIQKITELFNTAYESDKILHNTLSFVSNDEAEMIKMFRNNFLAVKVSFCNEMHDFCEQKNINYENVRKLAVLDSRIGDSHTQVPGHDGKKGFGGTCFPKDTKSLSYEMKKCGIKSYIIDNAIERNTLVDRPEKDWNNNVGRSVVFDEEDDDN